MAAPLFAPQATRPIPLALQLGSLPALAMGSPLNEKDMLPCIMITPSTPVHESDFEIHYFAQPEKSQRGFFGNLWSIFSPPTYRITLPDSEDAYPYGPEARSSRWPAARRFRTFLFLFGLLFFALHLLVVPRGEHGVFDMIHTAHRVSDDAYNPALVWEGWTEPPKAASSRLDNTDASLIDEDDLAPASTAEEVQATLTSTATKSTATEL